MTDLWEVRVLYTGGPGMPGTNTLFGSTNDSDIDDLRDALDDLYGLWALNHMATGLTVTIPAEGNKINSATGELSGGWTSGSPIVNNGGATGERVPLSSQLLVQLKTDSVVSGRRLRGRIFLPGATEPENGAGVPTSDLINTIQARAEAVAVGRLCVYSLTHKTFATVTAVSVWNQWAVLRSRRD